MKDQSILKKYSLFNIVYTLFLCTSCIFSPDDDINYVEISQDINLPPLYIDLTSIKDTLYVYGPVVLKYNINGYEQNREYSIQFTVDNNATQLNQFNGSFTFYPPFEKTGYFIAKLQVFTKSGTGSLADKLDAEKVVYERQWVMYVDSKPPDALSITSIKPEHGSLRIDWNKYERKNFKSYTIYKTRINSPYGSYTVSKVINDQDSTFYFDPSYVGGEATYWIVIRTHLHDVEGSKIKYSDNTIPRIIQIENITDSTLKVTCSSSKYFSNINKYRITEVDQNNKGGIIRYETNNPRDTVFTIKSVFGTSRFLSVRSFSKSSVISNEEIDAVESTKTEFALGEIIQPYNEILFSPLTGRYLLTKFDFTANGSMTTITSYNYNDNTVLGSLQVPYYVTHIYVSQEQDKFIFIHGRSIYIYDLVSLSLIKSLDLTNQLESGEELTGVGLIDSNTLLLCKYLVTSPIKVRSKIIFYDIPTETKLKEITGIGGEWHLNLSKDGKYLMGSGEWSEVIQINDTTSSLIFASIYPAIISFDPDNIQQVLNFNSFNYSVFNLSLLSFTQRTTIPIAIPASMDINNHHLLGYSGFLSGSENYLVVYDYLQNKSILKINSVTSSGVNFNFSINNGYLFSSGGTRLKFQK